MFNLKRIYLKLIDLILKYRDLNVVSLKRTIFLIFIIIFVMLFDALSIISVMPLIQFIQADQNIDNFIAAANYGQYLANFYNLRIFFGADIFDLQLTNGFILLYFCLFLMLSIAKRMIQIDVNKLVGDNPLIAYSVIDKKNLILLMKLSFYLINLVLLLYYFQYLTCSLFINNISKNNIYL